MIPISTPWRWVLCFIQTDNDHQHQYVHSRSIRISVYDNPFCCKSFLALFKPMTSMISCIKNTFLSDTKICFEESVMFIFQLVATNNTNH